MAIKFADDTLTTFHNGCAVRVGNAGLMGWCQDHRVRVYRDGIDWHTDQTRHGVIVLDATRRNNLPTGYVTVTAPDGVTDAELLEVTGRGPFGASVTRHDLDGTATVALFND